MYNVMLCNRATKTYSRIDFENKDAKSAWKLYSHWRRKYLYENYWVFLCKDEYLRGFSAPVFKIWDNINFGPLVKKIGEAIIIDKQMYPDEAYEPLSQLNQI